MATGFWGNLGQHFLDLGNGVVSIVQGAGESLSATADYNRSVAELNRAQAENYAAILQQEREEQQAKNKQTMLIIALLFFVPLALILALFFIKKKG